MIVHVHDTNVVCDIYMFILRRNRNNKTPCFFIKRYAVRKAKKPYAERKLKIKK